MNEKTLEGLRLLVKFAETNKIDFFKGTIAGIKPRTNIDFRLLVYFLTRKPGQEVSRKQIIKSIHPTGTLKERSVDPCVSRVNKLLRQAGMKFRIANDGSPRHPAKGFKLVIEEN